MVRQFARTFRTHRCRHRARAVVLLLDEQPVPSRSPLLRLHMHEHPGSFQAMPVQREFQVALAQPLLHTSAAAPAAFVPQRGRVPAAVFALRDGALEGAVVQRIVLHAHGQPLIAKLCRRVTGNSTAQQRPVPFEAQVVVVARGQVVLHREAQAPVAPAGGAVVARRCGAGRLEVIDQSCACGCSRPKGRSWAPRGSSRIISLASGELAVQ